MRISDWSSDVCSSDLEKFTAGMKEVKAGDPFDSATDMGPLSSEEQRQTVVAQLQELTGAGARLLFGGAALPGTGAYMSAGVLVDVPLDDRIANGVLFGPVQTVFQGPDWDWHNAVAIAVAVRFGVRML